MGEKNQKNFRLDPQVAEEFTALIDRLNSKGGRIKSSHIASAAIVWFLELPQEKQLDMIVAGRSFDIKLIRERIALEQDANGLTPGQQLQQASDAGKARRARKGKTA